MPNQDHVGTHFSLWVYGLRSKRFQSSYCAKVRAGAKTLPLPRPFFFFFALVPTLDELARKRLLRRLMGLKFEV